MDFVTHLPRTLRGHDAVWVIVDRLTKSAHFLAMQITFTLETFCRLYIREIFRLHGVLVSIISNREPRFTAHFLGEFPVIHRDTIGYEHRFSSPNGQSIEEDHPNIRGHATSMCHRS